MSVMSPPEACSCGGVATLRIREHFEPNGGEPGFSGIPLPISADWLSYECPQCNRTGPVMQSEAEASRAWRAMR
jgi:hypothetical protein